MNKNDLRAVAQLNKRDATVLRHALPLAIKAIRAVIAFDLTARQITRSGVPFEVFESGVQLWRSSDVRDRWSWRTTRDGIGRLDILYGLSSLRVLKRGSHVVARDFNDKFAVGCGV